MKPSQMTLSAGLEICNPMTLRLSPDAPSTAAVDERRHHELGGRAGGTARFRRSCEAGVLPNSAIWDQGGACGAAGPASAPALALGGPAGARRATPRGSPDQHSSFVTQMDALPAVLPPTGSSATPVHLYGRLRLRTAACPESSARRGKGGWWKRDSVRELLSTRGLP